MNNFFNKVLNLGINSTTYYWMSRRIRLLNNVTIIVAVIGISTIITPDLYYQYYTVSILGIPFLFFKDEIGEYAKK